jgi:hypothetical protein
VPVRLREVEIGRIRLDLMMTNVDASLEVMWLRRNKPQFRWENNTLKWKRKEIPFKEKKIPTVRIIESTVEKFARTVRKENIIFVVSVKSIIEEDVVAEEVVELLEEYKTYFQ